MRPINYQLTNNLVNNLVDLEVTNAEIKSLDITDDVKRKLQNTQFTQNIFHIAHILGHELSLRETEKFLSGKISTENNINLLLLRNYRDVLEYINSNRGNNYLDLNSDFLMHINKLLLNGWKDEWESRIRLDNTIDTAFDDWVPMYDDSIDSLDVAKEMSNTYDWYKNNITRVNALIRIPVAIYRMIQIMPFKYLNKFTIISASDFLLQKNGYTDSFFCTTKVFDLNGEEYIKLWNQAIESPTGNITFWVEKFISDIASEMKQNKQNVINVKTHAEENNNQPFLDLNKRQLKILRYLQTIPSVKREDYVQMFDVSTMTAFRDLNELTDKKVLKIEGKGRATKYVLANK